MCWLGIIVQLPSNFVQCSIYVATALIEKRITLLKALRDIVVNTSTIINLSTAKEIIHYFSFVTIVYILAMNSARQTHHDTVV